MQLKHRFPPPQQFSVTPTTILSKCEHNYSKKFPSFWKWRSTWYQPNDRLTHLIHSPLHPPFTPFKSSHPAPPLTPSSTSINNSIYILAFPLFSITTTPKKPNQRNPPLISLLNTPPLPKHLRSSSFHPPTSNYLFITHASIHIHLYRIYLTHSNKTHLLRAMHHTIHPSPSPNHMPWQLWHSSRLGLGKNS